MMAGVFSFITVDDARAVHFIILGAAGTASVAITSDPVVANDFSGPNEFHNVILTVNEPFTLHEISVEGSIDDPDSDDCDRIRVYNGAFPIEYGNVTLADEDRKLQNISDEKRNKVVDGNDRANPQTWSQNRDDSDDSTGILTFASATQLVTQLRFQECGSDTPVYSATVTYYLSGVEEGDFVLQDIEANTTRLHDRDGGCC